MDLQRTTLFSKDTGLAAFCVLFENAFRVDGADPLQFRTAIALKIKRRSASAIELEEVYLPEVPEARGFAVAKPGGRPNPFA